MENDILIDGLTDCLIKRDSGEVFETEYREMKSIPKKKGKWNFDWKTPQNDGYTVYELFIKGIPDVQGRIALKVEKDHVFVSLAESAPHNVGHNGQNIGVGAHLFAIACKISFDNNLEGFVSFEAKSDLVDHYMNEIKAKEIAGRLLYLDTEVANILVEKYNL